MNAIFLHLYHQMPPVPPLMIKPLSAISTLATKSLIAYGLLYTLSVYTWARNLYQGYQFKWHRTSGLNDTFKLVKCHILFRQALEQKKADPSADVNALIQECDALQASIQSCTYEKPKFLLELIHYYVENAPERSYALAKQHSESIGPEDLFNVVHKLHTSHPTFNTAQLSDLLKIAFDRYDSLVKGESHHYESPSIKNANFYLNLSQLFHTLQNDELKNLSFEKARENAEALSSSSLSHLVVLTLFCTIAQHLNSIGYKEKALDYVEKAQQQLLQIPEKNLPIAHLRLANAFLLLGEMEKCKQQLTTPSLAAFFKSEDISYVDRSVAKLLKEMENEAPSLQQDPIFPLNNLLEKLDRCSTRLLSSDLTESLLDLSDAYLILDNQDRAKIAREGAFQTIKILQESNNKQARAKVEDLLFKVISYSPHLKEIDKEALTSLQQLLPQYNISDIEEASFRESIAFRIFQIYNKIGLQQEADSFFETYLSDHLNREEAAFSKVSWLTSQLDSVSDHQKGRILEETEKLLPQLKHEETKVILPSLFQGYAKVNVQKSIQLFEAYENTQARKHFIITSITAVAIGALSLFPLQAPPLAAAVLIGSFYFS